MSVAGSVGEGLAETRAALVEAGLDPDGYGWGDAAEPLRWTVRASVSQGASGARVLRLGGVDHGAWITWREFSPDAVGRGELVRALWELRRRGEPARIPRTLAETAQAAALGVEMMDRAAGRAAGSLPSEPVDVLPAAEIKVGTPLDHVGDESGHVLHHFGANWERRALPDSSRERPVRGYLLVHGLPVDCRAERVAPAHGHAGGAWRVVLDRPIADYLESGGLRPFVAKDA